ncbi:MAG TPA: lipopolysaccharide biosynthesis protein [Baekduia sp.]|nr:lipopolysaccharide biosynthesis protein [Baekduia sp.]
MSGSGQSLGSRTLRGMAWAYGAYVGGRLLVLVQTAILARLLTPADFGLVALALTFMVFLDTIKDMGLGNALIISDPEETATRAQTAFSWGVMIGVALMLVTAAAGPLAAWFFRAPGLTALMAVFGVTFFVRSLGATHLALARKELNYRVRTMSELAEAVARGVVGISLALLGAGVWSLAIGFLCGTVVSTVVLWSAVKFRPHAQITRTHLRSMVKFGGMLTVIDVQSAFAYNLDYIFIGRVLGKSALGLYTMAFRLPELAVLNLANVAGDVLFPAYAAADKERLRDTYLMALRYTAMLTFPIAVALVVLADPLIHVLFGSKWEQSIPVMELLTLQALATTLAIPCGTVYKVTGQAHILLWLAVPGIAILVVLLVIFTDQGIEAVALCGVAIHTAALPFTTLIASRQLRLPVLANVRAVVPALVAAAAMTLVMVALDHALSAPLLLIVAGTAAGMVVYVGLLWLLAGDDLRRLRRMAAPA